MQLVQEREACGCDTAVLTSTLMPVTEAVALALSQVAPLRETETASLAEALGRISAAPVAAPAAMPFFDNSAMDGFALRCADLSDTNSLPIAGTVAAGDAPRTLPKGSALRIFTGAPLPYGADAVVMVERSIETDGTVQFDTPPQIGENIRRAGSDQAFGQILISANTQLSAHHIGVIAANGIARVAVVCRPRVAVFSTGDEVQNGPCSLGQIPDANRPMLLALAQQTGAEVTDMGILPDDAAATTAAFIGLGDRFDLIVTSGAVSMGGKDHIRDALIAAGGDVNGWRVALKPGKPVMFGRLGGAAITGLPGNPFAALVGFKMFVLPQLLRLLEATPAPFATTPAIADFDWIRKAGRAEVFPVRLTGYDEKGCPLLQRLGNSVSATLLPTSGADGLAMVAAETQHVLSGDRILWEPFCLTGGAI